MAMLLSQLLHPLHVLLVLLLAEIVTAQYGCGGGGILSGMFGFNTGYGYGGGYPYGGYGMGMCGLDSIFYHWTCCDYNLSECCVRLEVWAIILLVFVGLGVLVCLCLGIGACVWGMRHSSS